MAGWRWEFNSTIPTVALINSEPLALPPSASISLPTGTTDFRRLPTHFPSPPISTPRFRPPVACPNPSSQPLCPITSVWTRGETVMAPKTRGQMGLISKWGRLGWS